METANRKTDAAKTTIEIKKLIICDYLLVKGIREIWVYGIRGIGGIRVYGIREIGNKGNRGNTGRG